jgi:hypothetical protein
MKAWVVIWLVFATLLAGGAGAVAAITMMQARKDD